jgi:phosphatidylethanolamine N-methyltransferase
VTRISSVGKWAPLYDDEYDGEKEILNGRTGAQEGVEAVVEKGKIVLKGNALPWQTGRYELRMHHDGQSISSSSHLYAGAS